MLFCFIFSQDMHLTQCLFDCSGLTMFDVTESGVYTLLSDGASHSLSTKDVYCDMETDGGG